MQNPSDPRFFLDFAQDRFQWAILPVHIPGDDIKKIPAVSGVCRIITQSQKTYLAVYSASDDGKNFLFSCQKASTF